jgi:aminoglycoside phosphotransferase (APT) family kinase protein
MSELQPVRPGEELDIGSLQPWIEEELGFKGPIRVEQFPSGHSNLTYLLHVGDQELVLRRPPVGAHVQSGHDMNREYRILEGVNPVWSKTPKPLAFCDDASIVGAPFYLMTRVHGTILRGSSTPPDAGTMGRICGAFVSTFVEVHGVDIDEAGLVALGKPEGYVRRQVEGWSRRWHDASIDPAPSIDATIDWLTANQPAESGAGLIHNDFKLDNMVLDPDDLAHVRAVLDWEMATLGDPLMDLGSSLAYWAEPGDPPAMIAVAGGPTAAPGAMRRSEIVDRYANAAGVDVGDMVFQYTFGLFKLAVIAQQIYHRYHHGLTNDKRFADFGVGALMLGDAAQRVILTREI